jgi:hypothetical protein
MTQALGLTVIDAVRIPPASEKPRFTDDELRAIFPDSFGPLVEPFPAWPGLWHQKQSIVSLYIRAAEYARMGADIHMATMALGLPHGHFIKPPPKRERQRGERIQFPGWVH